MYTGVVPWEGVKVSDIAARLRCGEAPKIPQSLPSDAKDFIETCFSRNPEERGSAYELLFHPFLPRPQVAEEEKKTGEKKLNSFLLRLLKLKIRRTTSMKKSAKDAVLVADKESLKLRMNPHFKRTLNKVLSLKNHAFEEIHRLQFSVEHSSSRYELKISDFGNCLEVGQVPHSWAKDFPWVGTPNYMPPESVRDGVANKTLDLWSVGCLVLEMYTGVVPWEGVKVSDIAARLRCGEAPKIPQSLPSDAKDFIETCFSRNPEERGSAYELLFHPFLPRPQVAEEEKKTGEKKLNSFLLRLLKLKIRRTTSMKKSAKDAVLVADKESLKLRMNPHFKRTLNKVLSLKNHAFEEIHRLQFSVGSLRV
ncbi:hypothetical protein DY000_02058774 [Brassica cretica]|uniref:Protein kinase domain-containing protein n=1 Tax=Brassica cretica TaxID=69181 RepID=A0ABQ7B1S1_BRACR|nr:hypothetical protein DY000_02058774 [Brassica cretica]